jgi:hypothetical protein
MKMITVLQEPYMSGMNRWKGDLRSFKSNELYYLQRHTTGASASCSFGSSHVSGMLWRPARMTSAVS